MAHARTLSQIKRVLLAGVEKPDDQLLHERLNCVFIPRLRTRSQPENATEPTQIRDVRNEKITSFCQRLFDATADPENHVDKLDSIYAELFTFHVYLQPSQTILSVSESAHNFLLRLPIQPLGLPGVSELPDVYFDVEDPGDRDVERHDIIWPCLKVTTAQTTNVLRLILFREVYGQKGTDSVEEKQLVDLTAELLHECCKLQAQNDSQDRRIQHRWLALRCFLWAAWQRAQMLYFHRLLVYQFMQRVATDLGSLTILRSTLVAPGLTIQQFSDQVAFEGKAPYMCTWAFNLLRTDGIAVGSDFRLFHERYNQLLGDRSARCNRGSGDSCDGSQLGNCQRSRQKVEDQSMHDEACKNKDCPRLKWDEQSYISVTGGRAVDASFNDITDYQRGLLKYTQASDRTMAISHAWAHGQGGRPCTGLNQCLHIRYVKLAQEHGCDSYFLDTACIPDSHALRKEAIENINSTFRQSKITLIIDHDFLTVDVSKKSVELSECLLAAILVSDWNVRAWTLLEAVKGRSKIYLLCRKAQCMSYRKLVEEVASRGRIDMAIFALVAPHLISWTTDPEKEQPPSLETAGTLLSYRPASRAGDDLVIWSLLFNQVNMLPNNAEEFWRNLRGQTVATGFLVSSAGRVGTPGFTWAPDSAYAAPKDDTMPSDEKHKTKASKRFFRAFTGEESEYAHIEERGIFAHWCIFEFDTNLMCAILDLVLGKIRSIFSYGRSDRPRPSTRDELNKIRLRFLTGYYRHGALIQPKDSQRLEPWRMHQHIAEYSGGVRGTLVVLLASNRSERTHYAHPASGSHRGLVKWKWKAVFEWPADVPLPQFDNKMLWIS